MILTTYHGRSGQKSDRTFASASRAEASVLDIDIFGIAASSPGMARKVRDEYSGAIGRGSETSRLDGST
jgi:hypothetical protein